MTNVVRTAILALTMLLTDDPIRASDEGASAALPGVKLWYTDTGGKGVPIVLLLVNTGTSANWAKQNEAFSRAGYRVIAFDRRGWGRSMTMKGAGHDAAVPHFLRQH